VRDERQRFLTALEGITAPEDKRHIIGRLFVETQSEAMREFGVDPDHWLLGQGTIYPDTIESGGDDRRAAVIKTHHNRCREIVELLEKGLVVEPLVHLYKDEVREVGRLLGLSAELINRWPFPGPGLAIRCLASTVDADVRPLDPTVASEVAAYGFEGVEIPIQSVGVQGDSRTYREIVAVRGPRNYEGLKRLSTRLCNLHTKVNRVIYAIDGRWSDLTTARVRRGSMVASRIEILRASDFIVRSAMREAGKTDDVWQFPVVLIPVTFGGGGESIVLRPVCSQDGMTASVAELPDSLLQSMVERISALQGVDAVFLDVTNKPPATIEWE
jgi:GMP synthase (glutamine-hydrolysing)